MMSTLRPSRFMPAGHNRINVSFEFFPPKDEAMEKTLWESVDAAGAAVAGIRLGHLWRRRHDARAYPRHRQAHPDRNRSDAGGASDLRCGDARRSRRDRAATIMTPACATSWRCAAISVAGPGTQIRGPSGRLRNLGRSRCRHQSHQFRFRSVGVGLSGTPSRFPDGRSRYRHAESAKSMPARPAR